MRAVLGIDAAWTPTEPSGVALLKGDGPDWRVVCVAPSYGAFLRCGDGYGVDWMTGVFPGCAPFVDALLSTARQLAQVDLAVVAIDMPLSTRPFATRRPADDAISKRFGGRGCAAHSPGAARPGELGATLMASLRSAGFPLATTRTVAVSPRTVEVYPHPALLALLGREYRVPYKVSKSKKYWPSASVAERVIKLLHEHQAILDALEGLVGRIPFTLPAAGTVRSLSQLKRYEDALDALVCAWVGVEFLRGGCIPFGDENGAVWVPAQPTVAG